MRHDTSSSAPGDDLNTRVIGILAAQALRAPVDLTPDTTLESLGIDSLGLAEIVFAIEEHFDVTVPFDTADPDIPALNLHSVAAVCAAVDHLIRTQRG